LTPSGFEDLIVIKDKIRKILLGLGLSEVYNYSFIAQADDEAIELENPLSGQFKYLRSSLAPYLIKNASSNFRFFDEVKIFEIGKAFNRQDGLENLKLGIVFASKNKKSEMFFELKGIIERLFKKIGLVDYLMPESDLSRDYLISGEVLDIKSGGKIIGYLGRLNQELIGNQEGVLAEINLETLLNLAVEEREYRPLPKYPSIMRDISVLVAPTARVGEIMQAIQESDLEYIDDVDLMDEYDYAKKRSLTFRIVFQAEDRTLTDNEINDKMGKIIKILKTKFKAEIR
jgi:phenylalanyl-tRNA synthetase beta chain